MYLDTIGMIFYILEKWMYIVHTTMFPLNIGIMYFPSTMHNVIPLLHYFTANVMTVCLQSLGISVGSNIRVLRRSIYKVKN